MSKHAIPLCANDNHGPWEIVGASRVTRCEKCFITPIAAWKLARERAEAAEHLAQSNEIDRTVDSATCARGGAAREGARMH